MSTSSIPLNQFDAVQSVQLPTSHTPANLPVPNPTKSFWLDSAPDANPLATEGSEGALTLDADICIIGSGITGTQFTCLLIAGDAHRLVISRHQCCISPVAGYCGRQTR